MTLLRVLELFHGIGGMHAGLELAEQELGGVVSTEVVAAYDISSVCGETYSLNYGAGIAKEKDVKRLTDAHLASVQADLWVMSPPCQPYTCRGKEMDVADPRAEGLSRLTAFLSSAGPSDLPYGILLENVPGFEASTSYTRLRDVLQTRGYDFREYRLCPTQFNIPNRRRRFYLVAIRSTTAKLRPAVSRDPVKCDLPPSATCTALTLAHFLEGNAATSYYDESYRIPAHYLRNEAALDVVTPESIESNCFTGAYGRYAKGSGSVILCEPYGLRLFSSREITRIHAFPDAFLYPPSLPEKKRYQLIGNSVNVRVIGELCKHFLPAAAEATQHAI